MTFVIGDVHGEITKLKDLIDHICSIDAEPNLVFIGDYVDKGEDSRATIDFLSKLSTRHSCVFLLGNHEYYWLKLTPDSEDIQEALKKYGGWSTVKSFSCTGLMETKEKMLEDYRSFFDSLKSYWIAGNHIITHSGIPGNYFLNAPNEIPVEKYLFNRYDFIQEDRLYQHTFRMIFGHTGFFFPYVDDFKIGIDTSACYLPEQPITAYCLERDTFYDSNRGVYACETVQGNYCPNIVRVKPWRLIDN